MPLFVCLKGANWSGGIFVYLKSGDAFVCLFKNCVRLFEKCTFEYKVGEPRYDSGSCLFI